MKSNKDVRLASIDAPILKLAGSSFDNHSIEVEDLYQSLHGLKHALLIACEGMEHSGYTHMKFTLKPDSLREGCITIQSLIEFWGGDLMTALVNVGTVRGWSVVGVTALKTWIAKKTKQDPPDNLDIWANLRKEENSNEPVPFETKEDFDRAVKESLERINRQNSLANRAVRQMMIPLKREGDNLAIKTKYDSEIGGVVLRSDDRHYFDEIEGEEHTDELLKEQVLLLRRHDVKKPELSWDLELRGQMKRMRFADKDDIEKLLLEQPFGSGDFIKADVWHELLPHPKYVITKLYANEQGDLVHRVST
jgi:hypothetical protein